MPLDPHPEFQWISEIGSVSTLEMHRTFNMGMGMVVAVSKIVLIRLRDGLVNDFQEENCRTSSFEW
ncbi:MAG: hypothetical protein Ct9H90mP21_0230 [Methanobacteriota archaeon]|nr:MAG: hypothetical protein Ct9H90mP21_0230 [Euryarchaeota archaeon]